MFGIFSNALLIGYSGALMPGSLLTYTIDKSIKHGKKTGFLVITGHLVLELFIVIILMLGFGKYLSTDPAKIALGLIGGGILFFLGIDAIKGAASNKISINFESGSNSRFGNLIVGGAVISASNPYFVGWWVLAGLSQIQSAFIVAGIPGVTVFYLGHIVSDISWYGFVSILISKTRTFIDMKIYRIVIIVLGSSLLGFGLWFFYSGIKILFRI